MSIEANKEVVRRYIEEVINQGNLDLIDSFFAPLMRDKVRGLMSKEDTVFPDGQEEILDLVAEGDKVMARWLFKATHEGTFMGIPATGKRIEITGYSIYTFENGQITWDTMRMDWLDAYEQLGGKLPS